MGALKGPLVFAGILFFFSYPVFGDSPTTPYNWYPTGEDPVAMDNDVCPSCCKIKEVDGKFYYLVDYIYPPPSPDCYSGCIYQIEEYGGYKRVCFGEGPYHPTCHGSSCFKSNSTTAPSVKSTEMDERGCFNVTFGPFGGIGGNPLTDDPGLNGGPPMDISRIQWNTGPYPTSYS